MTKKKIALICLLTVILCIMTLGYAALQEQIDITGTSSIDSIYKVEITKVTEVAKTGDAVSKEVPSYTKMNATFGVGLTKAEDSITYNIEISNLGTVDAKLNNAQITVEGNSNIKVTKSGIKNGDILLAGESKVMTIKVSCTTEAEGTIKVTLDYTRLKGGTGEVVADNSYSIGDKVTFAGSNWYVIEDSPDDQDYVTLLKEKVLTNAELGNYATTSTNDTMSYYYSDTCHYKGTYGYTDHAELGCSKHNDYEGSKVKEFLEGTYINTLGSDKLKSVDGYKIRLIKTNEINGDLGAEYSTNEGIALSNVPEWIYKNFGAGNNYVDGYWTMGKIEDPTTTITNSNSRVWAVRSHPYVYLTSVRSNYNGVRPVINLLKSSI